MPPFARVATLVTTWTAVAHGLDHEARPPLAEPLFTESVTDVDGAEDGEVEVEANTSVLRARRGGGYAVDGSLEVEWLVTRRFGVRLEPAIGSERIGSASARTALGASAGVSWKLVRDWTHDFHLQVEAQGRVPTGDTASTFPGDPALPAALDLRAGLREGPVTFRFAAGYGFGGTAEHLPLRSGLALLVPFEASGRLGFFGLEADVDGARRAPLVAALNLVPSLAPVGIPFRVGFAIPWLVGERSDRPSLGLFVRVFYESERENTFGRTGRPE